DTIQYAAFSPDGRRLLLRSRKATTLWDAETGRQLHVQPVTTTRDAAPVFAPEGDRLMVPAGKSALLWDVKTGASLWQFEGRLAPVHSVVASVGSEQLLCSAGGSPVVWDLRSGAAQPPAAALQGADSSRFSADGRFALLLRGTSVEWWDLAEGRKGRSIDRHKKSVVAGR